MMPRDPKLVRQRYRIDRRIEARGLALIFRGWDLVTDLPVEVYFVPAIERSAEEREDRANGLKRMLAGRANTSNPFLLNVLDAHIDHQDGYYLITDRFDGMPLDIPIHEGQRTHPFGALCLAFQVCLGLHELHRLGAVHGGLSPRCIRLGSDQTYCKIVDFEFVTPREQVAGTAGQLAGYVGFWPPERWSGASISARQDIYQLGQCVLGLLCGKRAESRSAHPLFRSRDENPLEVEAPDFPQRLLEELSSAVEGQSLSFTKGNAWLEERARETSSRQFLADRLVPLLASWLAPDPADRPRSCFHLLSTLKDLGVPVVGHLVDPEGTPVTNGLFPVEMFRT